MPSQGLYMIMVCSKGEAVESDRFNYHKSDWHINSTLIA